MCNPQFYVSDKRPITGYYYEEAQTASTLSLKEEEMVARMLHDLTEGWEDTGVKCGVIGEVGCSWPLSGKRNALHVKPNSNVVDMPSEKQNPMLIALDAVLTKNNQPTNQ